jgi:hypothetical protein
MVSLKKIALYREDFVLEITPNFVLPIRDTLMVILICALFSFALNYGTLFSQETVKFSAYIAENGIWDPVAGKYLKCWPSAHGTTVEYDCENRTGVAPGQGDIFKPLNFTEGKPYGSST